MSTVEQAARSIAGSLATRDWDALRELLSDDFVDHSAPPGTSPGAEGYVRTMRWVTDELGISYTVDDVVAVDTTVALRITAHGRHDSDAFGFAPTGKPFAMATMHWYQGDGERLTAHWGVLDQLGMLMQVGAIPPSRP